MVKEKFQKELIKNIEKSRPETKKEYIDMFYNQTRVLELVYENPSLRYREYVSLYRKRYGNPVPMIKEILNDLKIYRFELQKEFKKDIDYRLDLIGKCLSVSDAASPKDLAELLNITNKKLKFFRSFDRFLLISIFRKFYSELSSKEKEEIESKLLRLTDRKTNRIIRKSIETMAGWFGVQSNFRSYDDDIYEKIYISDKILDIKQIKQNLNELTNMIKEEIEFFEEDKNEIIEHALINFFSNFNSAQNGYFLNLLFYCIRIMEINYKNNKINLLKDEILKLTDVSIEEALDWFNTFQKTIKDYGLQFFFKSMTENNQNDLFLEDMPEFYLDLENSFDFKYHGEYFKENEKKYVKLNNVGWYFQYRDKKICISLPEVTEIKKDKKDE